VNAGAASAILSLARTRYGARKPTPGRRAVSDQIVKGVRVDGRLVPFPKSISPEAQRFLASMVDETGAPRGPAPLPPASDLEAWRAFKAVAGAGIEQMLAPAAAMVKSTSETTEMGGALVHVATPQGGPAHEDRAYLEIHGGAMIHGAGEFCRTGGRMRADQHGVRTYAVDYRMPPEAPYPASLDDCLAVYRALLDRYAPQNIVVGGGSAGGNLAAALALRARDEGLPPPAGLVLMTPELDLTESGDSFETNRLLDVVLPHPLMETNLLYAAGRDLAHPYLSPLFGDFTKGYPPTFLQAGTRDLFLSNTVRMHRALRRAGVPVELHIFEAMPHGGFMGAPEDLELAAEVSRFVAECWGRA
jgi:acetyl esterase/lipase